MTKTVPPQTFASVVDEVITLLGHDYAAAAANRSKTTLYNWRDIDRNDLPNGDQMAAMDAACLDSGQCTEGPFFRHMRHLHEKATGRMPEHVPADPMERIHEFCKETGEVGPWLVKVLTDRNAPLADKQAALKDIREAIQALQGCERDIESTMQDAPLREVKT